MKNIEVAVIGKNYTAILNMARGAGRAGYPVTIFKTMKNVPGKWSLRRITVESGSKYVKKEYFIKRSNHSDLQKLLEQHFYSADTVILLPTDDDAASTIFEISTLLPQKFVFPYVKNKEKSMIGLMDKAYQKSIASSVGLDVAKGWTVKICQGHYIIPQDIIYPCFTKPQISIYGQKSYMYKCNDSIELDKVLQDISKVEDCEVLIEEFVKIENEYGVLGVCTQNEIMIPCLVKKVVVGNGSHKGVTMLGEVTPLEKMSELYEKLKLFLEIVQFVGLIDIDLYEANGTIFFNELNLRLGAFGGAAACADINLQKQLIDSFLGIENVDKKTVEQPILCISEKVAFEDYLDGYSTKDEYNRRMGQAEHFFLKTKDDPIPYFIFYFEMMKKKLKKIIPHI